MSAANKTSIRERQFTLGDVQSAQERLNNLKSDFLDDLERQMKELWSQYITCLDRGGFTQRAEELRNRYYNVYRCYQRNKEWKKLINKF